MEELYRIEQVGGNNRRQVLEASWVSEISYEDQNHFVDARRCFHCSTRRANLIALKCPNPYSSLNDVNPAALEWKESIITEKKRNADHWDVESLPQNAICVMYRNVMRIRATLFRRDIMKHVCVLDTHLTSGDGSSSDDILAKRDKKCFSEDVGMILDSTEEGHGTQLLLAACKV